jgi:error-prone DNA polymerase
MTANVITYRGKSAAREVGKALGFDAETLDRLSSLIGHWEWRKKDETLADNFQHAGFDLGHHRIAKYVELCERMQDLPRHLGQHSGGMVICQGMLNTVVPLERASMPGRSVIQWDKEDCADMGLVKIDLLGLGMMAVMEDCLDLIPRHYDTPISLANLPADDPEVYAVLRRADTVGMFQVESRAQMASIPRNAPTRFYDLVVQVAIIRPGPIVGKMMHPYMRRRQGKEAVTYPLESLRPVLERTLGVPLFQEQLLRIAMVVGNFSGTEAEELRKAIGMRRSWKRMEELMVKLRAGMAANDILPETQEVIVQSIQSFALYGFPESHAASFALIAYASAYFKVKHLAAFTCALLNNQPMGFYSAAVLVKDAQRHGLRVRPVDVQTSGSVCTIEHEPDGSLSLRLGLNYACGLKLQTAEVLVATRTRGGPFRSVEDLTLRVPRLNRGDLAQLARIGALNTLGDVEHRRDAIWQVEQASRPVGPLLRDASPRNTNSPLRQMKTEERLVADYAGTGLTTGPHPMAYRRASLCREGVLSAQDLQQAPDGRRVVTAGAVIARQRPGTAQGFIFLSMEDETGIANVIITPQLYEQQRLLVTRGKFLKVIGKLQNQDGVVHVKAERLATLEATALDLRSHDFH